MELLGKNLSELRQRCSLNPKRFSIGTAHRIVLQMLEAVEGLHQTGFIHKDIKPANFVTGGRAENRYTFYLMDFDQSRSYLNADGTHKPYAERVRFSGTYRYASVPALEFKEQSRRDDLHSLFYAYFEMLLGDLPWRKLDVHKTVLRMKQLHTLEKLARRMPDEAVETAKYLTTLTYESKPDYPALTNLLKNALKRYNVKPTDSFDWHIVPDCTKVQHWSTTPA